MHWLTIFFSEQKISPNIEGVNKLIILQDKIYIKQVKVLISVIFKDGLYYPN